MVGMAEVGTPISLDGVAVHPYCWCVCLCYLHFAPENPEDGEMYETQYRNAVRLVMAVWLVRCFYRPGLVGLGLGLGLGLVFVLGTVFTRTVSTTPGIKLHFVCAMC